MKLMVTFLEPFLEPSSPRVPVTLGVLTSLAAILLGIGILVLAKKCWQGE